MNFNQTLYGALHDTYVKHPEYDALLFMDRYLTYEELIKKTDMLAAGFYSLGIKKDSVVTLALPNVFEAIFALYALNGLGVVCHLVHPLTPVIQMEKFMKQTESKHLIIMDTFFNHYSSLLKDTEKKFILVNPVNEFGLIKKLGYKLINASKLSKIKYNQSVLKISNLYIEEKIELPKINAKKTAFLLHSGGTSGEPKTIELSNYAINFLASKTPYIMGIDDFMDKHMLAVLPMFHGFGLCMGIHAMLAFGGVDTLMPKFDSAKAVKLIKENQCNFIIGVPSLFESLLRDPGFESPSIKYILQTYVGGDYVSQDLKNRFNKVMEYYYSDARLLEGYGLTEVVTVSCVNTLDYNSEGTVGKPLPDIKMAILNPKTNEFLGANQSGEIAVSGPTMMNGYLNDKAATAETIIEIENEKWVKTGDLGFIDDDGYVHFKQRVKRIIKVSGMPILPAEIEGLVMEYPEVKEVAAIGVPDEFKGFRIKLFISWNNPSKTISLDEIQKKIKENLSTYAVPKEIVVLESLPKTIIGKINILELEKM